MKRIFIFSIACLFAATGYAQGFATFSVDGALTETVIKNPGKNSPGMVYVITGPQVDITNLSPKYKLLSGCSLENPLPKDFTKQADVTVDKKDGTSRPWVIRIKKLVPASLPFELKFSESNPAVFSNEAKGWAAVKTDETKSSVVRFGDTNVFFIAAFDAPAKELKFNLNVVGNAEFDGEFWVETSADGKKWKKLDAYSSSKPISSSLYTYPLLEDVRFIQWTYIERNKQNVNLNNITIE